MVDSSQKRGTPTVAGRTPAAGACGLLSLLGTDAGPGVNGPGRALPHPSRRAALPAELGLSRAPNAPSALLTACGMTDRRSRRAWSGLQSDRSLDTSTETATADQPEAAVCGGDSAISPGVVKGRYASPHTRRAELLGIGRSSPPRNQATYRIEAGPSLSGADSRSPTRTASSARVP